MTPEESRKKPERPCPVCGGLSYTWGDVCAHGLSFMPGGASPFKRFFRYGFKLAARACDDCGNVQMFAGVRPRDLD